MPPPISSATCSASRASRTPRFLACRAILALGQSDAPLARPPSRPSPLPIRLPRPGSRPSRRRLRRGHGLSSHAPRLRDRHLAGADPRPIARGRARTAEGLLIAGGTDRALQILAPVSRRRSQPRSGPSRMRSARLRPGRAPCTEPCGTAAANGELSGVVRSHERLTAMRIGFLVALVVAGATPDPGRSASDQSPQVRRPSIPTRLGFAGPLSRLCRLPSRSGRTFSRLWPLCTPPCRRVGAARRGGRGARPRRRIHRDVLAARPSWPANMLRSMACSTSATVRTATEVVPSAGVGNWRSGRPLGRQAPRTSTGSTMRALVVLVAGTAIGAAASADARPLAPRTVLVAQGSAQSAVPVEVVFRTVPVRVDVPPSDPLAPVS